MSLLSIKYFYKCFVIYVNHNYVYDPIKIGRDFYVEIYLSSNISYLTLHASYNAYISSVLFYCKIYKV